MHGWQTFWAIWLLFAGTAFAVITLIVSIKGFGDVKRMLAGLKAHRGDKE